MVIISIHVSFYFSLLNTEEDCELVQNNSYRILYIYFNIYFLLSVHYASILEALHIQCCAALTIISIIQITCLSELQGALVFVFAIVVSFFFQKQKPSLSWSATDKLHSSVYHCKRYFRVFYSFHQGFYNKLSYLQLVQ